MIESRFSGNSRNTRLEVILVAGLVATGVALPLIVSALAGTLDVPRNDDWSYRRMAVDMARTGELILDGISSTLIVGQIVAVQPLLILADEQPWAFALAGVIFAFGGVLGAYALARQVAPPREAAIAAGLLTLFPGYLAYATSFMSDVPALGLQFACLAMGAVATRHRPARDGWLVAAFIAGVLAFSIREFAIAALVSVAVVAIVVEPRRLRTSLMTAAALGVCGAIYVWRTSLPGQVPAVGPGFASVAGLPQAFSSVSFVIGPAALLGAIKWRDRMHRRDLIVGLEVGVLLVAVPLVQRLLQGEFPRVIMSNLTSRWGVPDSGYIVGGRPLLFGDAVWALINITALVATVVVLTIAAGILGASVRQLMASGSDRRIRIHAPTLILVVFTLAVLGGLALFSLSRPLFDRYLWVVVPPLAALFLRSPTTTTSHGPPRNRGLVDMAAVLGAVACLLALATVSLVYVLNSHAFDAGRWAAGARLVQAGYAPDAIDAGYEWVGYHATTPGDPTDRSSTQTFYGSWWQEFKPCAIVSGQLVDNPEWELIETRAYALHLFAGPKAPLYLYGVATSECEPTPD